MAILKQIKWWIYHWIGLMLVIAVSWVAYWAYVSLTDVNPWDPLSATLFNKIQENIRVLRTDVDNIPAWATWATGPQWIQGIQWPAWADWAPWIPGSQWIQWPAWADWAAWTSPVWAVVAFNLSSCPTGWIPADWTNSTPDLRWEFVRWLDSGRWVDSWRVLASFQLDEFKSHHHNVYPHAGYVWWTTNWASAWDSFTQVNAWITSDTWWSETRPRNVALLYCVKQ